MTLYPHETERDDGLGRLCEHHCHGCGALLFDHQPNAHCDTIRATIRAYGGPRRLQEILCEPCAEFVGDSLDWFFATFAETWREQRDRAYERSGLTQCCDAPRMRTWERDGESNLGPDKCDACREFVDSCGRRFEP